MEGGGYCTERGGLFCYTLTLGFFAWFCWGLFVGWGFFIITMVCEAERINFVWNRDLVCVCSRSSV